MYHSHQVRPRSYVIAPWWDVMLYRTVFKGIHKTLLPPQFSRTHILSQILVSPRSYYSSLVSPTAVYTARSTLYSMLLIIWCQHSHRPMGGGGRLRQGAPYVSETCNSGNIGVFEERAGKSARVLTPPPPPPWLVGDIYRSGHEIGIRSKMLCPQKKEKKKRRRNTQNRKKKNVKRSHTPI